MTLWLSDRLKLSHHVAELHWFAATGKDMIDTDVPIVAGIGAMGSLAMGAVQDRMRREFRMADLILKV